jgi:hypothetical protein
MCVARGLCRRSVGLVPSGALTRPGHAQLLVDVCARQIAAAVLELRATSPVPVLVSLALRDHLSFENVRAVVAAVRSYLGAAPLAPAAPPPPAD